MAYSQLQKEETEVHIKASADKFYDVFCNKTYVIANIFPELVQSVDIQQGQWGTDKSVITWTYFHEGKTRVAKEIVEDIDKEKYKMSFKVIEGDVMEHYKSFKFIMQATPKEKGGSVVNWAVEYEKQNDSIHDPRTMLQLTVDETKKIDEYFTNNHN